MLKKRTAAKVSKMQLIKITFDRKGGGVPIRAKFKWKKEGGSLSRSEGVFTNLFHAH